jgi:predicted enzyme related to lactoylglutathione lyase
MRRSSRPVVHLELHTGDLQGACAYYALLCGWRPQRIESDAGSYLALEMGGAVGGGVVESGTARSVWLPYVKVENIADSTEHARLLGASVLLEPREGPAGFRSVVAAPAGAQIAFWQPKRRHR